MTSVSRAALKSEIPQVDNKSITVHSALSADAYVTQIGVLEKPFLIYDFRVKDKSKLIYLKK